MPRGVREPSRIFQTVLAAARTELLAVADRASAYEHHGIRGDERAAALAGFLKPRLPGAFACGKGEAVDCYDTRTGQLDLAIYDQSGCVPLSIDSENLLLPCEALYAVIEVKTTLTRAEVALCLTAARKIRDLRPFKGHFVGAQTEGRPLQAKTLRCMYMVFAYSSDLSESEWAGRELQRLSLVGAELSIEPSVIDRILVVNRGLLNPVAMAGKVASSDRDEVFLEFYVHLMNFLAREAGRRPGLDLQNYVARTSSGWERSGSSI
jgi:hypothetical protein